jgi:hypothetical protein
MILEFLRRIISSTIIWCVFLVMYLAVLGVLGLGVFLTGQIWWLKFHQHATDWVMAYQCGRVILLAVAFVFVLVQPFLHLKEERKRLDSWRHERRSGMKD